MAALGLALRGGRGWDRRAEQGDCATCTDGAVQRWTVCRLTTVQVARSPFAVQRGLAKKLNLTSGLKSTRASTVTAVPLQPHWPALGAGLRPGLRLRAPTGTPPQQVGGRSLRAPPAGVGQRQGSMSWGVAGNQGHPNRYRGKPHQGAHASASHVVAGHGQVVSGKC